MRRALPPRRESIVIGGIATTLGSAFVVFLGFALSQLCFYVLRPECMAPKIIAKAPSTAATEKLLMATNSTTTVTLDREAPNERLLLGARIIESKEDAATATATTTGATTTTEDGREFPATAKFPPQCDSEMYRILEEQLPSEGCTEKKPWVSDRCAFSNKTVCGNARPHWFFDFVSSSTSTSTSTTDDTFRAIVVGCNKGYEAVNLLRMVSPAPDSHKKYDLSQWEKEFLKVDGHQEIDVSTECTVDGNADAVASAFASASASNASRKNVHVYCIEGFPKTANQLETTKKALGYGDELQISNSVVVETSQEDGALVWMYDVIGAVGVGNYHWTRKCRKLPDQCIAVHSTSMDEFISSKRPLKATATDANTNLNTAPLIDFMSITAEGSDYEILKGAAKDLGRIKYIDFGYHWHFSWSKKASDFADLIYRLKKKGFVCYFPGSNGQDMWRITDCWQDHYGKKYKASVGCVNANIPETTPLLAKMERMFVETLRRTKTT